MKDWVEIVFLLKNAYQKIGKGSLVTIDGENFIVKRLDGIVLLDEAVSEPNTAQVYARGIKCT